MVEQPSPVARFFGYAMIAIGLLIALLSGGCTLVVIFTSLRDRNPYSTIETALIFGLPFVAIGIGLFAGGRSLSRRRKPTQPPDKVF